MVNRWLRGRRERQGTGMIARLAIVLAAVLAAGSASAETMSPDAARKFVAGKLFAFNCFDGSRGAGRIFGDGSVIGNIQFRGAGPTKSVWLPAGTLRVKGEAVCASLPGALFEPCFNLERINDHSFRGSVSGLGFFYCDFTRRMSVASGMGVRRHAPEPTAAPVETKATADAVGDAH
jgi:hypothetical protein